MATAADLAKIGVSPTISDSVGRGGRNKPIDVAIVQYLLNEWLRSLGPTVLLPVDGQADQALDGVITHFQRAHMKMTKPDGVFSRSGKGIVALRATKSGAFLPPIFGEATDFSHWSTMNAETMLKLVEGQFGKLAAESRDGFRALFKSIVYDGDLYDIRWGAYMLATVKAETGVYRPIEEYKSLWSKHSGKGGYAEEVTLTGGDGKAVSDAQGKPVKGRYYGRGYVQLTWHKNYLKLGGAIGLGDALARSPERALEQGIAYKVASTGMRLGLFASDKKGKAMSLPRFIDGDKCNYNWARQIINGFDRADEIEGYAIAFEVLMMLSTSGPPKGG